MLYLIAIPHVNERACAHKEAVKFLRSQNKFRASKKRKIADLEARIGKMQGEINNSLTSTKSANQYLMQDLTGTRWEKNVEGWHAQRDSNKPADPA
jgi:DNA repair protein RadC